jgi:hypothetical protein
MEATALDMFSLIPATEVRLDSRRKAREILEEKYALVRKLMVDLETATPFERPTLRARLDGYRAEIVELEDFLQFGQF